MKSNFTKYLLVCLVALGCVAPGRETKAFTFDDIAVSIGNLGKSESSVPNQMCYFADPFYIYNHSVVVSGFNGWTSNCIDSTFYLNTYAQTFALEYSGVFHRFSTSMVSIDQDGNGGLNFHYWIDSLKSDALFNVPSIAGFTYTIRGQQFFFDNVFFHNDSIIFFDSSNYQVLQVLGEFTSVGGIIYADPFETSLDNLRYIDFYRGKAWSVRVSESIASSVMLGKNITNSRLNSIDWTSSYTISRGSSYFFPQTLTQTAGVNQDYATSQSFRSDIGFNYSRDLIISDSPVFGGEDDIVSSGGTANANYSSCFADWTNISSLANSWHSCRSQMMSSGMNIYEYRDVEDYVENMTGLDENRDSITSNPYCQSFIVDARFLLNQYSNNLPYYQHIVSEAKKYNTSSNMLSVEGYCGQNPLTHENNTISTREDIYGESSMANQNPGGSDENRFTSTLKNWIIAPQNYIRENLVDPYSGAFNSGYNQFNLVSCSTKSYFTTPYGNEIFLVCVAFLFFIFLSVF